MIHVECIQHASQLESLRSDWDRLSNGSLMRRYSWLSSWWQAYQESHKLHVLVAYREGTVCGILPLASTHCSWTGLNLVFMGSGKVCSDDLGILALDSDMESVAQAFATWLVESPTCCHWDHLNLDGIREENFGMRCFGAKLTELTGSQLEYKESPKCWATSLEGGLENFRARLTKRARKIFREAEQEVDSGNSQFEVAKTLEQALEFVDAIQELHQMRWKEKGIEGCFSEQSFGNFLKNAIQAIWNDPIESDTVRTSDEQTMVQRVHIALLKIGGVNAAGSICIRDRDALDVYLTGMNPEFAEVRPGWQLNACCIRHAIGLGCTNYDLLRGDEEYKERLGGEPTVQTRWLIASPRWTSQMRNAAYHTAVNIRQWWRSHAVVGS